MLDSTWNSVIDFVKDHEAYAFPLAFAIAMAEFIVGISILVPATITLLAMSTALGLAGADLVQLWIAIALGASLGDWVSYGLGRFCEPRMRNRWPLRNNQPLVERGHRFFERWGWISFFPCRFIGPLRSFLPLAAGICAMPLLPFALASMGSAFVWSGVVLIPAGLGLNWPFS